MKLVTQCRRKVLYEQLRQHFWVIFRNLAYTF